MAPGWRWRGGDGWFADGSGAWAVPLWMPGVALGLGWAVLAKARREDWECGRCGYDVRGLAGGVCPECGAGVPALN
jgi:ribosomal protein S27AE